MPAQGFAAGQCFAPTQDGQPASYSDEEQTQLALHSPNPNLDAPLPPRATPVVPPGPSPPPAAAPPRELVPRPPAALPSPPQPITIEQAVGIALESNPDLIVQRQELGVAGAQRSAADIYPFNPTLEAQVQSADNSQGLRQHVRQSYSVLEEIETGGKGTYRRAQADAALGRTGWEVHQRELEVVAEVYQKFQAALVARRKLDLVHETMLFNERQVENARPLLSAGRLSGGDALIAEAEAFDSRQTEVQARYDVTFAQMDLRATLGITEDVELAPAGDLNLLPDAEPAGEQVVAAALAMQPELQAKIAALTQADAAVALARANAWPDVTAGPTFEYDESKTVFVGGTLQIPLQIFNRKQGELMQAEAERARAAADLEQSQVKVRMRALAACQHYDNARRAAQYLRDEALPASQRHSRDAEKLLAAGQVDLLKVVEIRRRHLMLREQLLEAESRAESYRIELQVLTGRIPLPAGDVHHE